MNRFPTVKHAQSNTVCMQEHHMVSEAMELIDAYNLFMTDPDNNTYEDFLDECTDFVWSYQTRETIDQVSIEASRRRVIEKNKKRGYLVDSK